MRRLPSAPAAAGLALVTALALPGAVAAAELRAAMYLIDAAGALGPVGEVLVADGKDGARFLVELYGLPPGEFALRIHAEGECGPGPDAHGAMAPGVLAGDLWRPGDGAAQAGMVADRPPPDPSAPEAGPPELPLLRVAADGRAVAQADLREIADVTELWRRSLVVHDQAGQPIACGVLD